MKTATKRGTKQWAKKLGRKWLLGLSSWDLRHVAESQDGTPTLARLRHNVVTMQEKGLEPCADCLRLARRFKLVP